jgi:hypothetical protein
VARLRNIFQIISNFLFSRANREFLIFMFFLALSGIFWLLMTLNQNYEQEIRIPVRYVNVPKNVVITSGETDTLRVNVSDKGIILITYLYNKSLLPIAIDFATYATPNGRGIVTQPDLQRLVVDKLATSTKVISVKPEKLQFSYNHGERKTVPVKYAGTVKPDDLYYMAGVDYRPDSVIIYASHRMLDSISVMETEPLNYTGFRDTLSVQARMKKIAGVKTVPEVVDISFRTDVLTESNICDIPVKGINMPHGKMLRTFPAKVCVSFVTGLSRYRNMKPTDFEVVADYNEIQAKPSSKCHIMLTGMPDGITRAQLSTEYVDYLIEE